MINNGSKKILYFVFLILISGIFKVRAAGNPFDWNAYTEAEPWKAVGSKIPWPKVASLVEKEKKETKVVPHAEKKWTVVSSRTGRKHRPQKVTSSKITDISEEESTLTLSAAVLAGPAQGASFTEEDHDNMRDAAIISASAQPNEEDDEGRTGDKDETVSHHEDKKDVEEANLLSDHVDPDDEAEDAYDAKERSSLIKNPQKKKKKSKKRSPKRQKPPVSSEPVQQLEGVKKVLLL
jgi:hypothetical protein